MSIYKIFVCRRKGAFVLVLLVVLTIILLIRRFDWRTNFYIKGINEVSRVKSLQKNNDLLIKSSKQSVANCIQEKDGIESNIAWIKYKNKKGNYLEHVINGFKAHKYKIFECENGGTPEENWNVLWSHSYPFLELKSYFLSENRTRCINHFPGTGFITNKVSLASLKLPFIPASFRLPKDQEKLKSYSKDNPNSMFVQKSNNHRGIEIKRVEDINFEDKQLFVQKFIHTPLLVDGYKFDIGVYTAITSVDPLRVYIFDEVLFRFCTEKYHPFSTLDPKKYVVGDDYRPTWNVPSLSRFYKDQKLGMKGSFDLWLSEQNKDPKKIWRAVEEAIREVFYLNEHHIIDYSNKFPHNLHFFEVMRLDFIIEENLTVYLMEANMSPNLSSAHFKENTLLYEQMLFNLLSQISLSYNYCSDFKSNREGEMKCSYKNTAVFPEHCSLYCSKHSECKKVECQLCTLCKTIDMNSMLCSAYLEHMWKGSFKRVIPKAFLKEEDANIPVDSKLLSHKNTLMSEWYRGKCLLDKAFCS